MELKGVTKFLILASLVLAGCNSARVLYRSSDSGKDFWKVNAFTLSHCGCTQLFVDNYKSGRHDFEIMYTDNVARKYIYEYNESGMVSDTTVLVAKTGDFTMPFDSLDLEIYRRLRTIVNKNEGLVYKMKWTDYIGYIKEDR